MSKTQNPSTETEQTFEEKAVEKPSVSHFTEVFVDAVEQEDTNIQLTDDRELIDWNTNNKGLQLLYQTTGNVQILIGRDETSHKSGLFAHTIPLHYLEKQPRTVEEALEKLKPSEVVLAEQETGVDVQRQGEWWFIETNHKPEFTVSGDLGVKPYGSSPMDNHVATRYGFDRSPNQIRQELEQLVRENHFVNSIKSFPQCLESVYRYGLDLEEIFEHLQPFYVQGTVRHRGNEHKMLKLQEDKWYKTVTHGVNVYQPDPSTYYGDSVRIDRSTVID